MGAQDTLPAAAAFANWVSMLTEEQIQVGVWGLVHYILQTLCYSVGNTPHIIILFHILRQKKKKKKSASNSRWHT